MDKGKGLYIVFEGGEGTGKSTQINFLKDNFEKYFPKRKVVLFREPGGPKVSEAIRNILLHLELKNGEMHPKTEALLFAAARAQFLEQLLYPALKRKEIVLVDRSFLSSYAYQGASRKLGDDYIKKINEDVIADFMPNLILLLDLDSELGLKRRMGTGKKDRLDKESIEFHKRVRKGYLDFAKKNKKLVKIIDASLSPEDQAKIIWKVVKKALKLTYER